MAAMLRATTQPARPTTPIFFDILFMWDYAHLVGGFDPSKKYQSWIISPSRGEDKKYI